MQEFLLSHYNAIKAVHFLAIIAWFAGLLYLPRLFVYHHQAEKGGEAERFFVVMERRLAKGIMLPSIIAVWLLGLLMLWARPDLFSAGWFHLKFALVLAISGIHGFYAASQRKFADGQRPRTEKFWRVMNEVPFILLIVVVFLALTKAF